MDQGSQPKTTKTFSADYASYSTANENSALDDARAELGPDAPLSQVLQHAAKLAELRRK